MSDQAMRERGTDLHEILDGLQQKGKMFDNLLSRLITIGNKLSDESQEETKGNIPSGQIANKPSRPGTISDLNNCIYGFSSLVDRFETQIAKLEKII